MKIILALIVSLCFVGCTTTSFENRTYDSVTQKSTRTVYAGYFNGWSYIVENEIAIEGVVELQPEVVGRTGLGEKVLQAQLHLFLYNQTSDNKSVEFNKLVIENSYSIKSIFRINKGIDLPPLSVDRSSRVRLATIELPISFYETQISIAGKVGYLGQKLPFSISLNRLTQEELNKTLNDYRDSR
jgi:hypothetical protein